MTDFQIERGNGVSAWRQIETHLRRQIESGVLQPGQRIDTEATLSRRLGVNRHTLRRALLTLAEAGLLSIEQGRGTFVRNQVIDYPIGSRTRFSEIVAAQDHEPAGQLLGAEELPAGPEIARALDLAQGEKVLRLDTLSFSDDVPLGISSNWFPARRFPEMAEIYRRSGSISAGLAHHRVDDYRRVWTGVVARLPSRADADLLRQPPNRPVLVAESINADSEGRPVQFGRTRFAAARVQIVLK